MPSTPLKWDIGGRRTATAFATHLAFETDMTCIPRLHVRSSRRSFFISNLVSGKEHRCARGVTCCETLSLHFTVSTALKACLKPGTDFPRGRLMSKGS